MNGEALHRLAVAAGLHTTWEDVYGQRHEVRPETLRAMLAAMDLTAETPGDIGDSLSALASRRGRAGALTVLTVNEPFDLAALTAGPARLHLEDGTTRDVVSGATFTPDVVGYHQLELNDRVLRLAVCPKTAASAGERARPGQRPWGVAAQVYSLSEVAGSGFGDFAALARAAEALSVAGADGLAISPVHALFAADPSRFSPYGPSSRLFLNVLFADPARLGVTEAAAPAAELIDWPAAAARRLAALRQAYANLPLQPEATRADIARYCAEGGDDLQRHALFEALHGHFFRAQGARGWMDWPVAFHQADGEAARAFGAAHRDEVDFHLFCQWLAHRSLAEAQSCARTGGMAIGLITDIAVGMDPGGSHAWSRPQDLLENVNVGAPPDLFQANGQDWGLTAFSPTAMRASGYAGFLATLRSAMRHAGGVRIDHILGLQRLWLTPRGASPTEGVYLSYPLDDLLGLIALESRRSGAIVIGEDLGTVPPGFRDRLEARGVMGMDVLMFERDRDGAFKPPRAWSARRCAMTSTHDLPPIAGWWREADLDLQAALGADEAGLERRRDERAQDRERLWAAACAAGCAQGPMPAREFPEAAVDAALAFISQVGSDLAIIPLEDLIGLVDQVNAPGTTVEHPNWSRRLPGPLHDLLARPEVRRRLDDIRSRRMDR